MRTNFEDLEDRNLLVLAGSDRDAFEALYRRHAPGILGYFSHAVGRTDLAFDLTAETFAAVLVALPRYQPTAAPGKSWLYAIAKNRLVDAIRKGEVDARIREQLAMQAIVLSQDGETEMDRVIARLDGQSALELVKDLPENQRAAVTARFVADQDYSEIAAEIGTSEQVIRKRVSRGLGTVRSRLGRKTV
jgi:RNA polymerase sigma factor (sigma-70 family)